MRIYLAIMDESEESEVALRFAARRAAKVGGAVHMLALVPPQPFTAFAAVQATIEEEARARAEALASASAGKLAAECGACAAPVITVRVGEAEKVIHDYLDEHPEISALVLGAAREGSPGPLVAAFAGAHAGTLPCPVFVIPGALDAEAIERVS